MNKDNLERWKESDALQYLKKDGALRKYIKYWMSCYSCFSNVPNYHLFLICVRNITTGTTISSSLVGMVLRPRIRKISVLTGDFAPVVPMLFFL
jgi:hypothetical protein